METYRGHVRTPQDAIILFEACRLGLLPRVQRRLSEKERQSIRSGSVFVWDEREAGMRRWTDGKSWSASRVAGSFLNYREMEGKRGGNSFSSPSQKTGSPEDGHDAPADGASDGYRYKPDGLIKQSFSITTSQSQHLHLISYFARSDPGAGMLPQPSSDPQLRHVHPQKGMYPDASIHDAQNLPAVTQSPMLSSYGNSSPPSSYAAFAQRHPPTAAAPSPGYGWPPSPMHTPPAGQYSHHPGAYPPQPNGHSPGYFPGQPHPNAARPPPGPTAFDRAPPPLGNSPLPHPAGAPFQNGHALPLPRHRSYGQAPSTISSYPPPPPSEGPGPAQYSAYPPQPNAPPPSQSQYPAYSSRSHDHLKSEDTRPRHEIPPPAQSSYPPRPSGPPTVNSASTIPSINSLINRSPEPVYSSPYGHAPSRPSPPGGERQTISSEKSGFREDLRVLRQLDKKFI